MQTSESLVAPSRPILGKPNGSTDEPPWSVFTHVHLQCIAFTPELATQWLKRGKPNRKLKPTVVRDYARVMTEGGWRINGEPLIVNRHGELLNGQHRLNAVIESGLPSVQMLVVFGVEDDAFSTIDTGCIRQAQDIVSMSGFGDPSALASAAKWLWRYEVTNGALTAYTQKPTNEEVLRVIANHPDLVASVPYGNSVSRLIGRGTATFLHYIFHRNDPVTAKAFFTALATGENVVGPVLLFREALNNERGSKKKMSGNYKVALAIKAFNYTRRGTAVKILMWRSRGRNGKQPYPTLD